MSAGWKCVRTSGRQYEHGWLAYYVHLMKCLCIECTAMQLEAAAVFYQLLLLVVLLELFP